jgi:hypothetical protein
LNKKDVETTTNEEKLKEIIESKDFLEFLTNKSNIIEKALNQEDIFSDYGFSFEEKRRRNKE